MEDIRINGLTADEWEALAQPQQPTNDELVGMGILQEGQEEVTDTEKAPKAISTDREYEKLSVGGTLGDMGKAAVIEVSKAFLPKSMELNYTPKTRAADITEGITKFGWGMVGLGKFGMGLKAVGALTKLPKVMKATNIAAKLLGGEKLFQAGAEAGLMAKAGTTISNIATQGTVQGAILDATLLDPYEGRVADLFGDTDNTIVKWLQTNEEDSALTSRFKNVVDGAILGMGVNAVGTALAPVAKPIMNKLLSNLKDINLNRVKPEQAEQITKEVIEQQSQLEEIAKTSDLVETVRELRKEAMESGEEASQYIADRLSPKNIEDAQAILKIMEDGDDVHVYKDGTFAIKVSKYEDAYKVSPEEYAKQLYEIDEANGLKAGDTAIAHQNNAVRDTWTERNLLDSEDGSLFNTNSKAAIVKGNKNTDNIIDYYKDKWGIDKSKISVQFGKWKNVSEGETKGTAKKILIKIDKDAPDIYATLRAELEHARDIAKGEVPKNAKIKGSGTHFARYIGDNEGEVASGYTYKKSVGRHNALQNDMNPLNSEVNNVKFEVNQHFETWYKDKTSESTIGKLLEHPAFNEEGLLDDVANVKVRHLKTDKLPIDTSFNDTHILGGYTTVENGEVVIYTNSSLSAKMVEENLYHELQHARDLNNAYLNPNATLEQKLEAITNIQEVMQAVKNGDETAYRNSKYEKSADLSKDFLINKKKEYYDRQIRNTNNGRSIDNNEVSVSHVGNDKAANGNGELGQGTSREEGLGDTSAAIQGTAGNPAEQLKLDFNKAINETTSPQELINKTVEGTAKVTDVEDLETVLNKTIDLDPEVSGTTWKAIAEDADKLADLMKQAEELGLDKELTKALSMDDVTKMDEITRKVLAAQKLSSQLADKLADLGANPPIEQKQAIIDMIDAIGRYTKETGSASGRSLQARKFVNKAIETFGTLRTSELTKEGINTISDLLTTEINKLIDLNFTRGDSLSPQQLKEELLTSLMKDEDNPFIDLLIENSEMAAKFDDILTSVFADGKKLNQKDIYKKLSLAVTEARYDEVFNAIKLTDEPENKISTIRKWTDAQGGLTSYYVHNLLSGVGTLAKNVISGGMNTLYFPAKKIVAGMLGGGSELSREGWNTYKNLKASWKEAWSLGKQAFLEGDGKLSMMKDTMSMGEDEVFNGFREWNFDFETPEGVWHAIQNIHSFMTRAMGASDEFMSQLNYRAIKRAKAIEAADKRATQLGTTDEKIKSKIADRIFEKAFDSDGKPLDVGTLAEAKDILYQLPLNGQIFDRRTGNYVPVRPQTMTTQFAGTLNSWANQYPMLKIMFPFVKTGANILQQNLEHNGIYAILSDSQRSLLMSNSREGALARSQVAFGCLSFALGTSMAIDGLITGSAPADAKERQALFETGWKPYSVRIGDQYISYQGYEPLQTILGFAADSVNVYGNIVNNEDDAKWQKMSQQVMALAINNFLDKAAFRSGLRQIGVLVSPEENAADFAKSLAQTAQGFLPDSSMIKGLSSLGNRDVTAPQSPYERIFNNYFNRGLGDYRRDVFGNRQDNIGLLVTNVAPDNADLPEYAELEYLAQFGFSPSDISKTISETSLKYTQFKEPETGRSVYDTMQEELSQLELNGMTLQEAVRDLVTSQEYQNLPIGVNMNGYKFSSSEDTKLNAIRSVFIEYNNAAMQSVIDNFGDLYIDNKGRTMAEAVDEIQMEKMNQGINQGLDQNIGNQIKRFGQ